MMFSVLLSVISSLIAYLELSMALVHMNIVRQRIRNNFRQSLMSKDTRKATYREQLAVEGTIAGSMFCLLEHAQSEIRQLRLR